MKTPMFRSLALAAGSVLALAACGGGDATEADPSTAPEETPAPAPQEVEAADMSEDMDAHDADMAMEAEHEHAAIPAPAAGEDARVDFVGTDGEPTGEAVVTGGPNGLLIRIDLEDLEHGFHGAHLHMVGDCSDYDAGFKASGSHVNPTGNEHGLMNEAGYELADLPNVYVHHNGHARAELFAAGLMLEDVMDEDGFAIVVHQNPDDHMTQPIGGAGPRLACAAFTGTPTDSGNETTDL